MNKIVQVNLGGYPFTLDENAYQRLQGYLDSLRRHFAASTSCDEIVADIEQRLAELLLQAGEKRIITLNAVEEALGVLGHPAEIAEEADTTTPPQPPPGSTATGEPAKRLFRNPDDAVASGVCSGLAAYFGIDDPIWFRIGFVVSAFISLGFTLLIYIMLMVAVPAARSSAQKLQMRGEPINVDNIARTFEEGAQRFGDSLRTGAEKIGSSQSVRRGISQTGRTFVELLKGAVKAVAFLAAGVLLLILGARWLAFTSSFTVLFGELNEYFFPTAGLTWIAFASVLLAFGIPMVGVLVYLLGLLFRYRPGRWYRSVTGGLFVLSIVGLVATGLITLREFKNGAGTKSESLLEQPKGTPPLYRLEWLTPLDSIRPSLLVQTGDVEFGESAAYLPHVSYTVRASTDSVARIVVYRRSMGRNRTEAKRLADAIGFDWRQEDNRLIFDNTFRILRGDKWRIQEVDVWLELPVGSILQYDTNRGDGEPEELRTFTITSKTHERL
jgi:phage shock protein PspC (stress-responsive transcriptional regulator)